MFADGYLQAKNSKVFFFGGGMCFNFIKMRLLKICIVVLLLCSCCSYWHLESFGLHTSDNVCRRYHTRRYYALPFLYRRAWLVTALQKAVLKHICILAAFMYILIWAN